MSSRQITGQGWYEFDITSLGREWLKYESRNYGSSSGKSADYGYIFSFSGPGVIIMASADSSNNSAYISFNYTEDTSLDSGAYIIRNQFTKRSMQDSGSLVSLNYGSPELANQRWIFTKASDGLYTIRNAGTGRYIYFSGSVSSGSILQAGSLQMKWRVVKNTDGSYRLFPVNSLYALEERYFNQSDYKVYAEGYNGYANQQWTLEPVAEQIAVKLPNGTYIQRTKTNGSTTYKNEAGVALEVNDSRQIIIEPIVITDINASGDDWHKTVAAPFTYTITGSTKIDVSRSGNTLTITGKALGEASITITSGAARTVVPVVVADKVLDVPHIRQEKSQWCWVACAQMIIKTYDPNNIKTQAELVTELWGSDINKAANRTDIINVVEKQFTNEDTGQKMVEGKYIQNPANMTDNQMRQILDSGSPIIYLVGKYKNNGERESGHFRVIYGYSMHNDGSCVYFVYDPWNTCRKYDPTSNVIGNNIHYDIWRRSLVNIKDEEEQGISTDIKINNAASYYEINDFVYFEEVEG